MKGNLKNLQVAFDEVFAHASYIALASALAVAAFLFAVWFPNLGLLTEVFTTSSAPLATKLGIATSLIGGIRTNFSLLSAGYTIAIAILFGLNIAMIVYLLKRKRSGLARQEMAAGLGGVSNEYSSLQRASRGAKEIQLGLRSKYSRDSRRSI